MSEENAQLLEQLKTLIPINELPPNLQTRLFDRAQILEVKKSRFIFKQGDKDNYSYYLLDGEVELHANKALDSVIQSNSDRAKYALAQLQPRQFSAKAKTQLRILQIDRTVMDQLLLLAQEATVNPMLRESTEMEVDEVDGADDDGDWMTQMLQSELFARMPMANMHQLFALLEPIEKKAGEIVIQQGEPGEHYYIVSEGRCAVSRKPSPKSSDVKLAELKTGDSFGEEALISNSTRNATITMITDGSLMRLAKDTFIELIKKPTLQSLKFADAEALVNEGAQWLDVRFPNEHQESSIKGSLNIPLNSIRLQIDKLDETKKYILFCDTGGRSSTGAFLLAERGFEVSFLEGGLVNNSEAVGIQTVIPEEPKPVAPKKEVSKKEVATEIQNDDEVDAEVRVEMLNAELETTQIRMEVEAAEKAKNEADAKKKKEHEETQKNLAEARKKLEAQKLVAEAEAKKKAVQEELKLKKLQEEAEKKMQQEKKQLEEIYNKNAKEMEKLQKEKEQAEEKMLKEREKLEKQAEAARKQLEEAERIKQEVEASKKLLEEQAEKKRLLDEESEKKIQAAAKAEIEAERKKLAEQYERNNQEFEDLKKEKAAAEAARLAAKEEAENIIREYKISHDKTRSEEEAKLKAERLKLEEEAKKIQETMKLIQQAKLDAEKIKQDALEQATVLKEKQMDSTSSQAQRDKLEVEIKAAEEKAIEAEREIEDAVHKEKLTESAQQENEADLNKKKKEEEDLLAKIQGDLEDFEDKQQEESASITQIQMTADHMKRIKAKANEAKQKAASADKNLLSDISNQLGKK